jgi:hypothetical protein
LMIRVKRYYKSVLDIIKGQSTVYALRLEECFSDIEAYLAFTRVPCFR